MASVSEENEIKKKRPPTALTLICGVCESPAPDHLHFGANSCYSCRAFFRRTGIRKLKGGTLRCRSGTRKCPVTNKAKNCIHCRYQKCILIGMSEELIQGKRKQELGDEDYQVDLKDENELLGTIEDENQHSNDLVSNLDQSSLLSSKRLRTSTENYNQFGTTTASGVNDNETNAFPNYEVLANERHAGSEKDLPMSPGVRNYQQKNLMNCAGPFNYFEENSNKKKTFQNQDSKYQSKYEFPISISQTNFQDTKCLSNVGPRESSINELNKQQDTISDYNRFRSFPQSSFASTEGSSYSSFRTCSSNKPYQPDSIRSLHTNELSPFGCSSQQGRPSVIQRGPLDQDNMLKYETEMLKYHGRLLQHTGNVFNYHASLLEQQRLSTQRAQRDELSTKSTTIIPVFNEIKQEDKKLFPFKTEPTEIKSDNSETSEQLTNNTIAQSDNKDIKENLDDITQADTNHGENLLQTDVADENKILENISKELSLFLEAEQLLKCSPYMKSLDQYTSEGDQYNPMVIEQLLQEKNTKINKAMHTSVIQSPRHISPNGSVLMTPDNISTNSSVPIAPYITFTTEEFNVLTKFQRSTDGHLRRFIPNEMFEAQVKFHLGTIDLTGIMTTIAKGRMAQNQYHYLNMLNSPYFDQLTPRTQRTLMKINILACFSLTMSLFFFGHDAQTTVDLEDKTGLKTGIKEYLCESYPWLIDQIKPLKYDQYFAGPWATSREAEIKHKELTSLIGKSLKEMDNLCFLLLYGITLFNIESKKMEELQIPKEDIDVITKAQSYFDIMYKRYTKHILGWKKASETTLNQRYLLNQMNECVTIFAMQNLHLNDLTDSKGLDANSDQVITKK